MIYFRCHVAFMITLYRYIRFVVRICGGIPFFQPITSVRLIENVILTCVNQVCLSSRNFPMSKRWKQVFMTIPWSECKYDKSEIWWWMLNIILLETVFSWFTHNSQWRYIHIWLASWIIILSIHVHIVQLNHWLFMKYLWFCEYFTCISFWIHLNDQVVCMENFFHHLLSFTFPLSSPFCLNLYSNEWLLSLFLTSWLGSI